MLKELEQIIDKYEGTNITEQELMAAAAELRAKQFVWRSGKGQNRHYDILTKPDFKGYFENLFEAFGDHFFISSEFGYCGIIPMNSTPVMKLTETFFLLILAKLHDVELRKGCADFGRTTPSEALLLDEYEKLTGRAKPRKKETDDALDRLMRYGVIELGRRNEETDMRPITILPTIMKVVSETWTDDLISLCGEDVDAAVQDMEDQIGHVMEGSSGE